MPERATVFQTVQIGVETVEGTLVPANKKLQAFSIALSPNLESYRFRPMGQKLDALVVPGKEWTAADLSGVATYDELIYPLSSVLCTSATVTTVLVTGKQWIFTPSAIAADAIKSFSVEQGDATRAQRVPGLVVTDFGITWNRDSVELSGTGMGQLFQDGITMTASPTAIPLVPILPTQIDVYMDPTSGALGTTKLLRVLEGELSIGSRYVPLWVLNSANTSYVARVEAVPEITFRMLVEADAAGMALLTSARAGTSQFIRVQALGGQIPGGTAVYTMKIDMAVKVEEIGSLDDQDGVYAIEWDTRLVYDATWTKYMEVTLINSTAAL